MPKMIDNMTHLLIVVALCTSMVYMMREIRGCESDVNKNVATCIESTGDPYLCCINYKADRDHSGCIKTEKARKLAQPR